jgi:hypothetical protein
VSQKRIVQALKYMPLAGLSFWVPDVLLHWLRAYRFSGLDVLVLTFLLPIITVLVVAVAWKRGVSTENHPLTSISALVGIWLFGPLMMSVGATFSGGGFSQPDGWRFVMMGTSLFPLFTFTMSTYDGTLGALLLTTGLLPFLSTLCALIDRRLRHATAVSNASVNRL